MGALDIILRVIIFLIIFAISSIPLYLAVKALKGKTTFAEVIMVNLIAAIIIGILNVFFFIWGGVIAFILVIFIYKAVFELSWWKALLAWFLQFVILAILIFLVLLIEFFIIGMTQMLI
jgi:hypothetical protein